MVYENCDEINTIIFSLLDLIYPFKWNYPINSFMLHETSVLLDAPFAIIMGVNSKYKNLISFRLKKNQFNKETLVYDLKEKNFIFNRSPSDMSLPIEITAASQIAFVTSGSRVISSILGTNSSLFVIKFPLSLISLTNRK